MGIAVHNIAIRKHWSQVIPQIIRLFVVPKVYEGQVLCQTASWIYSPLQSHIWLLTLKPTLKSLIAFFSTLDICMKTKYQTKPQVISLTSRKLTTIITKLWWLTCLRKIISRIMSEILSSQIERLYNIMYIRLWIQTCDEHWATETISCNGFAIVLCAVCGRHKLHWRWRKYQVVFYLVHYRQCIMWLTCCKKLTIIMPPTQYVTD